MKNIIIKINRIVSVRGNDNEGFLCNQNKLEQENIDKNEDTFFDIYYLYNSS